MRTTRRSSLPRYVYVATGFMPGWMAGLNADDAEVVPPARCVRSDWLYARMDRGVAMRTTRRSSLPRGGRSDWLYARMDRGVECGRRGGRPSRAVWVATGFMPGWIAGLKCGRRGGRPSRAVWVATGFMPGWMAGWKYGRRGGRPSRAVCVRSDWLYARTDRGVECGRRGGRPSRALVDLTEQL
jgi:hypothetical protein